MAMKKSTLVTAMAKMQEMDEDKQAVMVNLINLLYVQEPADDKPSVFKDADKKGKVNLKKQELEEEEEVEDEDDENFDLEDDEEYEKPSKSKKDKSKKKSKKDEDLGFDTELDEDGDDTELEDEEFEEDDEEDDSEEFDVDDFSTWTKDNLEEIEEQLVDYDVNVKKALGKTKGSARAKEAVKVYKKAVALFDKFDAMDAAKLKSLSAKAKLKVKSKKDMVNGLHAIELKKLGYI